jgi:hypothetical protein
VPARQVIDHDQPCRKCGYNVRGLATDNRCPECGTPVGFSFHGDLLQFCDPGWVETLYRGARAFIIGIAVIILSAIAVVVLGAATGSQGVALLMAVGVVIGWILVYLGWWWMTEPDPSGLGEDKYGTARKIIRISLLAGIVEQVLQQVQRQIGVSPSLEVGLQVIGFALGVVGVIGAFAQFNYLKKLARRIPDMALSNRANFLMYALGGTYGVLLLIGLIMNLSGGRGAVRGPGGGSALVALGCFAVTVVIALLVFLIMYLRLVERIGARFKEQAAIARSTWAATAFAPPSSAQP